MARRKRQSSKHIAQEEIAEFLNCICEQGEQEEDNDFSGFLSAVRIVDSLDRTIFYVKEDNVCRIWLIQSRVNPSSQLSKVV